MRRLDGRHHHPAIATGDHARCLRAEPGGGWPACGSPAGSTVWCPGSCGGQSRPVSGERGEKLTAGLRPRCCPAAPPYRHVLATLLEALSQHGDHVLVVVQELLDQLAEASLHVLVLDLQAERQQKQRSSPPTSLRKEKNKNSQNSSCQRGGVLPGSEGNHLCVCGGCYISVIRTTLE